MPVSAEGGSVSKQMRFSEAEAEYLCEITEETATEMKIMWPSEWYESKKILMTGNAAIPGYVQYKNTPYWEEPVNCVSQYHPARTITIVGPAQDGKTFMVLEPMIGYTIECNPGNILHLTGNSDLAPDAALRVDSMIDNCKLRYLIKPSNQNAKIKNSRTGDTQIRKEFPNGIYRVNSVTKKNALRQNDIYLALVDDTDAAKKNDKKVGNMRDMVNARTKAFEQKCKRVYTSSPEILGESFIWESWELSDKRKYFIPCPCEGCGELIELESTFMVDKEQVAGLYWEYDEHGRVDQKSVCYVCQVCGGRFDERDKLRWMGKAAGAKWIPTAVPVEPDHWGFKKSALLAPPGMTSWYAIACAYHACNMPGQPRDEAKWQTFLNTMMGEPYSRPKDSPKASDLMKKARNYQIGVIPEAVSEADGNGDIILLTLTADCNGTLNDARIDYELKGWSRNGATYSVKYGSLGTFIPNQSQKQKEETVRERFSYKMDVPNSVWKLFDEVLGTIWHTDTGRKMKIFISGIDAGHLTDHIFAYIDRSQYQLVGLMGDKENEMIRYTPNQPVFKQAKSRHNLYMLNANMIKDDVSNKMRLPWDSKNDVSQPHEFMNFPNYGYADFFSHYESEERREDPKTGYFGWQKKTPTAQNHQWDNGGYHFGLRDIFLYRLFHKVGKQENFTWEDFASKCPPRIKAAKG